jgi:hypothetical protein
MGNQSNSNKSNRISFDDIRRTGQALAVSDNFRFCSGLNSPCNSIVLGCPTCKRRLNLSGGSPGQGMMWKSMLCTVGGGVSGEAVRRVECPCGHD